MWPLELAVRAIVPEYGNTVAGEDKFRDRNIVWNDVMEKDYSWQSVCCSSSESISSANSDSSSAVNRLWGG